MKAISVLQLGDIHYPQSKDLRLVDIKDTAVPSLSMPLSPKKLTKVARAISTFAEANPLAAILLCGDLTTRGDTNEYRECVAYLIKFLNLTTKSKDGIHVVPGNHDVDRKLCTNRTSLNLCKFLPLQEVWRTAYEDILVTKGVRETLLSDSHGSIDILSLNSCVGCGEWRLLPEHIRDQLSDAITDLRIRDPVAADEIEAEQLDTPMIDQDDLEMLNRSIRALNPDVVPLVLAHHNLLPQELQRIALYTELINSGPFRTTLTMANRPVVYCHGHIHKEPIESISDSTRRGSQLICVSAPALTDGFNELRFCFSAGRQPLGVEVVFHRIQDNGNVIPLNPHRIPFLNSRSLMTQELEDLRECLTEDSLRFQKVKTSFDTRRDAKSQSPRFAELLRELEWIGMIDIESSDRKYDQWVVRRR